MKMKAVLLEVKVFLRKVLYWFQYLFLYPVRYKMNIADAMQTIQFIIDNRCSVCRYGDGEMDMITSLHIGYDDSRKSNFQTYNKELAIRLKDILKTGYDKEHNVMVCIPYVWKDHGKLVWRARRFVERSLVNNRKMIECSLDLSKHYGDSYFTRFYIDYQDKNKSLYIQLLKRIWENRDLCIVEGEQSRLGVGNDLFDGAHRIERILCPATSAFDKYPEIMDAVRRVSKDRLILIALGHTATVLAYDLAKEGFQAIDIGHVDVEYEWFRMKAKEKVALPNKFVNEVEDGRNYTEEKDIVYLSQVKERIL